jgi:hypothetical protein
MRSIASSRARSSSGVSRVPDGSGCLIAIRETAGRQKISPSREVDEAHSRVALGATVARIVAKYRLESHAAILADRLAALRVGAG